MCTLLNSKQVSQYPKIMWNPLYIPTSYQEPESPTGCTLFPLWASLIKRVNCPKMIYVFSEHLRKRHLSEE